MKEIFNVVWQSHKERKPEEKYRSKTWALIKLLMKIGVVVWKILKFFFDEGGPA